MKEIEKKYLEELFIEYAKVNTRSNATRKEFVPTTPGQKVLAQKIVAELKRIGVSDAYYNEASGFAIGHLAGNISDPAVTGIGFIAHLDTADYPAEDICPKVHPNYDGKPIVLNEAENIILDPKQFPDLKQLVGQTLITSDGTTLLGTDDKAGIVSAIGALKYFIDNPEIEHGDIYVGFGPDEEIGLGGKRFCADDFKVEFAYTLDNGQAGELQYETFNASQAVVEIKGTSVHPGNAYHTLVNAVLIAQSILKELPKDEVPEKTKDREGFILVTKANLKIDKATLELIIRDFDKAKFKQKEELIKNIVSKCNANLDHPRIKVTFEQQYENIANTITKHPYVVNLALAAYKKLGLTPKVIAFRGGTDGNFITQKGIPTPNLFNGGGNYHGRYEYVTSEQLLLTANTIKTIVKEHVAQSLHGRDERALDNF